MKDLLNNEIEAQFSGLQGLGLGSPDHSKAIEGLNKLMATQIEIEKVETERLDKLEEKKKQQELDAAKAELERQEREDRLHLQEQQLELQRAQLELQAKQAKQNSRNNLLQLLVTLGVAAIGVGVNVWGTKYTTGKEMDDGVIQTTEAGKAHTRKLFNR